MALSPTAKVAAALAAGKAVSVGFDDAGSDAAARARITNAARTLTVRVRTVLDRDKGKAFGYPEGHAKFDRDGTATGRSTRPATRAKAATPAPKPRRAAQARTRAPQASVTAHPARAIQPVPKPPAGPRRTKGRGATPARQEEGASAPSSLGIVEDEVGTLAFDFDEHPAAVVKDMLNGARATVEDDARRTTITLGIEPGDTGPVEEIDVVQARPVEPAPKRVAAVKDASTITRREPKDETSSKYTSPRSRYCERAGLRQPDHGVRVLIYEEDVFTEATDTGCAFVFPTGTTLAWCEPYMNTIVKNVVDNYNPTLYSTLNGDGIWLALVPPPDTTHGEVIKRIAFALRNHEIVWTDTESNDASLTEWAQTTWPTTQHVRGNKA